MTQAAHQNVDADEIAKFEKLAHRWWDPDGDFKPLHDVNPVRADYIDERAALAGTRVLDVGCGGGILTETLAARGADATGIDMGSAPLEVAKLHALESGVNVRYEQASAESYAEAHPGAFDTVACLEMLEHVPDIHSTVAACAELTRPGGHLFFSTINRHPVAYGLLILGAEYITGILPKGTHDYAKFIRPSELAEACRAAGLTVRDISGLRYNPFSRRAAITRDTRANYMLHAVKP